MAKTLHQRRKWSTQKYRTEQQRFTENVDSRRMIEKNNEAKHALEQDKRKALETVQIDT